MSDLTPLIISRRDFFDMPLPLAKWRNELRQIMKEMKEHVQLQPGQVLVIGCSTSEVIGEKIGTAGSMDAASVIFEELQTFAIKQGITLSFQCCEHLNRAIVTERKTALKYGWEEVSVIPAPNAGGSMATYAFRHFQDPVVVECIKADAGIDIGNTLIGMHLKHVAVPVRINQQTLGKAHVTIAKTRPKLIGGSRAQYANEN